MENPGSWMGFEEKQLYKGYGTIKKGNNKYYRQPAAQILKSNTDINSHAFLSDLSSWYRDWQDLFNLDIYFLPKAMFLMGGTMQALWTKTKCATGSVKNGQTT